jgi:hypothetical protein
MRSIGISNFDNNVWKILKKYKQMALAMVMAMKSGPNWRRYGMQDLNGLDFFSVAPDTESFLAAWAFFFTAETCRSKIALISAQGMSQLKK